MPRVAILNGAFLGQMRTAAGGQVAEEPLALRPAGDRRPGGRGLGSPLARPFPLAIFVHGNHDPLEKSTPGYLYVTELLASYGIIAATIDANFLDGAKFGEETAAPSSYLEHVKQFRTRNGTRNAHAELRRLLGAHGWTFNPGTCPLRAAA